MGSLYWTYEKTKEESEKYETIRDFRNNSPSAYNAAKVHKWMNSFTHFKILHKRFPYTYNECLKIVSKYKTRQELRRENCSVYNAIKENGWTDIYEKCGVVRLTSDHSYEECYEAALKCTTKTEFHEKYSELYHYSTKHKWLKNYTWFKTYKEIIFERINIYTFEECYKIAKQYKTQTNLIKNRRDIWNCIIKNGWKNKIDFWKILNMPKRHLTYEDCYNVAIRFKTKKDFRLYDESIYNKAHKMGWLKEYTWFVNISRDIYGKIYSVYRYYFKDHNAIYVGLTMDAAHRDWRHIFGRSSVRDFALEHDAPIPKMKILLSNLNREEAQRAEDNFVRKYKEMKLNVLNKGKTGVNVGSLGGFSRKYTKEYCHEIAKKFNYPSEFKYAYPYVYDHARKHKYLKDYTWFKRKHNSWSNEKLLEMSRKYESESEFRKNERLAYRYLKQRKLINQVTWWKKEGDNT